MIYYDIYRKSREEDFENGEKNEDALVVTSNKAEDKTSESKDIEIKGHCNQNKRSESLNDFDAQSKTVCPISRNSKTHSKRTSTTPVKQKSKRKRQRDDICDSKDEINLQKTERFRRKSRESIDKLGAGATEAKNNSKDYSAEKRRTSLRKRGTNVEETLPTKNSNQTDVSKRSESENKKVEDQTKKSHVFVLPVSPLISGVQPNLGSNSGSGYPAESQSDDTANSASTMTPTRKVTKWLQAMPSDLETGDSLTVGQNGIYYFFRTIY